MVTVIHHYQRTGWCPVKLDGYFKYRQQAYHCKNRFDKQGQPITMEMTFDEWWTFWQTSGKWPERGVHRGQFIMARIGGLGPYRLDNVFVDLAVKNADVGKTSRGKTVCDRCGLCGDAGALRRWHFDNCQVRGRKTRPHAHTPLLTCHCGKTGRAGPMVRWHFDNCAL
jgi:hypothetical protein